jgi:hypothetical protein
MTPCKKPVSRRLDSELVRDAGKMRRIVVTVYPSGLVGLRPEKTRREELLPASLLWELGVKRRVEAERREKRQNRGRGEDRARRFAK